MSLAAALIEAPSRCAENARIRSRSARKLTANCLRRGWTGTSSGWAAGGLLPVDHLHALREPAPLVLVPRPQLRRLNAQLEFLGEAAEIIVHPNDAAGAGVSDDQRLIVSSAHHELTGVARVDASVRRGAVSVPHGHAGANVNLLNKLLNKQGRHRPGHRDDALLRRAGQPAPGVTLLRGDLVRLDGNKWAPRQR